MSEPVCACGHLYDEHDQGNGSEPCEVADCGCIAYEDDPQEEK